MLAALEKIQYQPREPGETAIPEIGTIIAVIKACGVSRKNRETGAGKTTLAAWQCPKCRRSVSDFVLPTDFSGCYCRHCGTAMDEIHRESMA